LKGVNGNLAVFAVVAAVFCANFHPLFNMPMEKWQQAWAFDFAAEYSAGTDPRRAADKAFLVAQSESIASTGLHTNSRLLASKGSPGKMRTGFTASRHLTALITSRSRSL
jgi:hypothetical protein